MLGIPLCCLYIWSHLTLVTLLDKCYLCLMEASRLSTRKRLAKGHTARRQESLDSNPSLSSSEYQPSHRWYLLLGFCCGTILSTRCMYHVLSCVTQPFQALHIEGGVAFYQKGLPPKPLSMLFLYCWLKLEEADSNPSHRQMGCETSGKLLTFPKKYFPQL